jgi:hypothetical protein
LSLRSALTVPQVRLTVVLAYALPCILNNGSVVWQLSAFVA